MKCPVHKKTTLEPDEKIPFKQFCKYCGKYYHVWEKKKK